MNIEWEAEEMPMFAYGGAAWRLHVDGEYYGTAYGDGDVMVNGRLVGEFGSQHLAAQALVDHAKRNHRG